MDLLQELMGTWATDKDTEEGAGEQAWRGATRRSIERWLGELETAGWLLWTRREDASRRYHLRTSARTASDAALLTTLRTLINFGKATLADVETLLHAATQSVPNEAEDCADDEVAYDERFEIIRSVPLLVLDDLGTESATAWAREKLYQIINHRYNAQLPTIITSNRSLDTFDGRITSRMLQRAFNNEVLRITAADYRRREIAGA